jgi:hypothetical protein
MGNRKVNGRLLLAFKMFRRLPTRSMNAKDEFLKIFFFILNLSRCLGR